VVSACSAAESCIDGEAGLDFAVRRSELWENAGGKVEVIDSAAEATWR
jgi:hypothetical protein